jgi:hypothetical protein
MAELKITRGSVSFRTEVPMTLEDISNLANASKIAGIPASARITHISFSYGMGVDGRAADIQLAWDVS